MTIPTLTTPRLRLRAHALADFPASAAMWADADVTRHISGTPSTTEASWSRLLRYAGHWALLGYGYWVVETHAGDFVGELGFADYHRTLTPPLIWPEAGWVITPAQQHKGFATEAMQAALSWADAQPGFDQTACIFDPAHNASLRVAQKLGYTAQGAATYQGQPTTVQTRPRQAGPRTP